MTTNNRYGDATQAELDKILEEIIDEDYASALLTIPGVSELLSEHYNNEILKLWKERHSTERFVATIEFIVEMGNQSANAVSHALAEMIDGLELTSAPMDAEIDDVTVHVSRETES